MPSHYLHLGIDTFIAMMPEKTNSLTGESQVTDGFYFETIQQDGQLKQRIRSGSYGKTINQAYHSTVRHLANCGLNIIVDDVMNGAEEQKTWRQFLEGVETLFVGVHCDPSVLAQREQQRGDRMLGAAIEQVDRVHAGVQYDLELSTSELSSQQCARAILHLLTS